MDLSASERNIVTLVNDCSIVPSSANLLHAPDVVGRNLIGIKAGDMVSRGSCSLDLLYAPDLVGSNLVGTKASDMVIEGSCSRDLLPVTLGDSSNMVNGGSCAPGLSFTTVTLGDSNMVSMGSCASGLSSTAVTPSDSSNMGSCAPGLSSTAVTLGDSSNMGSCAPELSSNAAVSQCGKRESNTNKNNACACSSAAVPEDDIKAPKYAAGAHKDFTWLPENGTRAPANTSSSYISFNNLNHNNYNVLITVNGSDDCILTNAVNLGLCAPAPGTRTVTMVGGNSDHSFSAVRGGSNPCAVKIPARKAIQCTFLIVSAVPRAKSVPPSSLRPPPTWSPSSATISPPLTRVLGGEQLEQQCQRGDCRNRSLCIIRNRRPNCGRPAGEAGTHQED